LALTILSLVPDFGYTRLVEPFAGSAAVTLAAASQHRFRSFLLGDALEPFSLLWKTIVHDPASIAKGYELLWHREQNNPIDGFYEIRAEFNADRNPAKLLYLPARCVKNSERFNQACEFNVCFRQACVVEETVYFFAALPRRRADKSIWLTLPIEKASGSKS
jgi:DNA adenine methylase